MAACPYCVIVDKSIIRGETASIPEMQIPVLK